jgi:hypothetical protein
VVIIVAAIVISKRRSASQVTDVSGPSAPAEEPTPAAT